MKKREKNDKISKRVTLTPEKKIIPATNEMKPSNGTTRRPSGPQVPAAKSLN